MAPILLVGFTLAHFLCKVPWYPVYPGLAPFLRLQCPPCCSQQLSCLLGMLPGRKMLGADAGVKMPTQLCAPNPPAPTALFRGASAPQQFFEGFSPGAGSGRREGCVNPISSPRNVYLSKFNSPAGCIPPKPTCSLVAELWVWLLLPRFLAAWGWWFAARSLFSADAGSFKVPGKPVLPLAGFIFKSGCTALRTGGCLVLSPLGIYPAVGFRKSPLVPL